jgi:alpha-1,2-mannosyltransferase
MMAAGLVTLAHRSGGPLMDIVIEDESARNGFLASHDLEYAEAIKTIIQMNPGIIQNIFTLYPI